MSTDEFLEHVQRVTGLESETEARDASLAVLETLGERIGDSQAEELAASLPEGLAEPLTEATPDEAQSFSFDEFVGRVAQRIGVEEFEAIVRARGVFDALNEIGDEDEVADARSQLPGEFDLAFDAGEFRRADEFLGDVRERADLDSTDEASSATTAVLETLGERLSEGEAADLATFLPPELKTPLTEETPKEPPDFPVEEFLERVADRENVGEDEAETHARAVLGVLGEVVGETEFRKARSQLPRAYDALFEDNLSDDDYPSDEDSDSPAE